MNRNWEAVRRNLGDFNTVTNNHETRITVLEGGDTSISTGTNLIPFQITAVYGTTIALAQVMEWNGSAWVISGTTIYVIDITTDGRYSNNYVVGHRGWCVFDPDREEFTGGAGTYPLYLIVEVEGYARWLQVVLTSDMVANTATADIVDGDKYWGGYPNPRSPGSVTIYDPLQKWVGALVGEKNFVVWDERRQQYIVIAPPQSTDGISMHRFTLTEDLTLAGTSAAATVDPPDIAAVVWDTQLQWEGLTGAEGWAVLMQDSGLYEIIAMEGPARFVRGLSAGGGWASGLTLSDYWGSPHRPQQVDSTVATEDPGGLFSRSLSGAKAIGVWNEGTQKYLIVESQSKAGLVEASTGPVVHPTIGTGTVNEYAGTQQDVQNPGGLVSVINPLSKWLDSPGGRSELAIFDAINNRYWMVAAQEHALFVEFALDAPMTKTTHAVLGDIWEGTATVVDNQFHRGVAEGVSITVWDRCGKWRWKAPTGALGVAVRAHNAEAIGASATAAGWFIVSLQQYKRVILFALTSVLYQTNDSGTGKLSERQDHIPAMTHVDGATYTGSSHDGELNPSPATGLTLWNPQTRDDGVYKFYGPAGSEGLAALCEEDELSGANPQYWIMDLDCPPPGFDPSP